MKQQTVQAVLRSQGVVSCLVVILLMTKALSGCVVSHLSADCRYSRLQLVPAHLPTDITHLDLRWNLLAFLPNRSFSHLPRLLSLDLSSNLINDLEPGAFVNLTLLQVLSLHDNQLRFLPLAIFRPVPALRSLQLSGNQLSSNVLHTRNQDIWKDLRLERLDLSGNFLETAAFPETFSSMKSLKKLHLAGNQIWAFSKADFAPFRGQDFETLDLSLNPTARFEPGFFQQFNSLDDLDLSQLDLSLPDLQAIFAEVADLNLTRLKMNYYDLFYDHVFASLQPDTFQNLFGTKLQHLQLSSSAVQDIADNSFRHLPDLRSLDLSLNSLSRLPQQAFSGLLNLQALVLSSNPFPQIPGDALSAVLQTLQTLELSDVMVDEIHPGDFGDLPQLTHLSMSGQLGGSLQKLSPGCFQGLPGLTVLDLRQNRLGELPDGAFSGLQNLKVLLLNQNSIRQLEETSFSGMPNLRVLEISRNHLITLPEWIFQPLQSIEELKLDNNNLFNFLGVVKLNGLEKLKRLNLSSNKLGLLPVFDPVSTLQLLDLSYNQVFNEKVTYVSEKPFRNLSNLVYLSLSNNQLDVIQKTDTTKFFEGLASLEVLKMSRTGDLWKAFGNTSILHAMPALKVVDLSSSGITSLPRKAFVVHVHLEGLDLSYNEILSLPGQLLPPSPTSLQVVNLRRNRITVLPESRYGYFVRGLQVLDLRDNFFQCDCDLQWFVVWANSSSAVQGWEGGGYMCNSPSSLHNKALSSYNPDCMTYTSLYTCIVTTTLISLYILTCFVVHRYGWWFSYMLYMAGRAFRHREIAGNPARRFRYDAFVAYSSHDERWITNELVPNLEHAAPRYRLCIGARDFVGGVAITQNIAVSVEASRKTVCVVTRSFVSSSWCNYELQASEGRYRVFDPRRGNLVLIFLEKIPDHVLARHKQLNTVVERDTYLVWPCDVRRRQLFWARLRDALGQPLGQDDRVDPDVMEEEDFV
ncbi:PREDICTED: toll-like receptor 3 [Branchiostoma belcheri]|uniref:Toll-like receptor 3 n=1 Tax=Branchiostoma belcheri TaxID=7741 RepID=A0A6P4YE63_BRABE|nr:PREDICTED: toll-like receptor 3 [Branchiostoma belcheri]